MLSQRPFGSLRNSFQSKSKRTKYYLSREDIANMLNIDFVFFSVDRQYKNAVFIFQRDRSAFLQLAAMTETTITNEQTEGAHFLPTRREVWTQKTAVWSSQLSRAYFVPVYTFRGPVCHFPKQLQCRRRQHRFPLEEKVHIAEFHNSEFALEL
jgi:hypothetical protein